MAIYLGIELLGVRKGACSECQPFPRVDVSSYTPITVHDFLLGTVVLCPRASVIAAEELTAVPSR